MSSYFWHWYKGFGHKAQTNNDPRRLKLIQTHQIADRLRSIAPEQAYAAYQEGRTLAETLDEPCWVLLFAQRMAHVCIYELENLDRAMDLVIRDYVLSTKPIYQKCPVLADMQRNILETYLYYDPVGYQQEVSEVLDMLERYPSNNYELSRLLDFRAQLMLKTDNLDEALYFGLKSQEHGGGFSSDVLLTLVRIYWERGEYANTLKIALERENMVKRYSDAYVYTDAQAWTAAMLRKTGGDDDEATARYQHVMTVLRKITIVPNSTIYDALADYNEAGDTPEDALKTRDTQLEAQQPHVGADEITTVRLRRARLLGRLGMTEKLSEQLKDAYVQAKRLKKPEVYLGKLSRIESGDYSEVTWKGS